MSSQEYSRFSEGVHAIFLEIENQITELTQENKAMTQETESLTRELKSLQQHNAMQEQLSKEIEDERQNILEIKRQIKELNERIQNCGYSHQDNLRIQAIRDREIKRRLQQQSEAGDSLANYLKAEMAAKAEAEKQEEIMQRSDRSLQIAKQDVAELEERLQLLAEKLEHDKEVESVYDRNASNFLELHQRVLLQSRQMKSIQSDLIKEDLRSEELAKKRIRAQKLQTNTERMKKLVMLEEAKLELIKKKALTFGISVPETVELETQ